jgi:hypothetical protein
MISALIAFAQHPLLNEKQLESATLNAFNLLSPGAVGQIDRRQSKGLASFNSSKYRIGDLSIYVCRTSGEVVILSGYLPSLKGSAINSDEAAVEKAKDITKILRPRMFSQLQFRAIAYPGSFGVAISRTIDGVTMLENGDFLSIDFDRKNTSLFGFRYPPTEAGIHKIDKWLPSAMANSTAVRFAFDIFKGPTQLNFDSVKKTYVGENWFRGMPNPQHRAFTHPALKEFLFPAYVVRYIDADAIRKSDQAPMELIDVFVDAEDNSIFGYIIWAAGGAGTEPAKPLDGEKFETINLGGKTDKKIALTLRVTNSPGAPSGVPATLYSSKKAIKVSIDRHAKLIWRGKTAYQANESFWKSL